MQEPDDPFYSELLKRLNLLAADQGVDPLETIEPPVAGELRDAWLVKLVNRAVQPQYACVVMGARIQIHPKVAPLACKYLGRSDGMGASDDEFIAYPELFDFLVEIDA